MNDSIEIVGADANNLKEVNVELPRSGVTMIVGVSGSGKSSLLSATLAAEGERRLATFFRVPRAGGQQDDVTAFIGPMPPTVHVGQRTFRASVRTTVGTSTGLLGLLRRLFLKCSTPFSDSAKKAVPAPSAETYAGWIAAHHRGKVTVWVVAARQELTDGAREVAALAKAGVQEVVVWGRPSGTGAPKGRKVKVKSFKPLSADAPHTIEAEIGSLPVTPKTRPQDLVETLRVAFATKKDVIVELHGSTHPDVQSDFGPRLDSARDWVLSEDFKVYARPSPSLLSFNAPSQADSGACPECAGTGRGITVREDLLIPHPEKSMHDGAFALWTEKNYKYVNIQHETIEGLRAIERFDPDVPWNRLSQSARALVLGGTEAPIIDRERRTGRKMSAPRAYPGFRRAILERVAKGGRAAESLAAFVDEGPCPACDGSRWSHQARALRVAGRGIHELLALSFAELCAAVAPSGKLGGAVAKDARGLVRALHEQAEAFVAVGLGHLSGDRGMLEVSEGESRRTRIAGVLSARAEGLMLLLDEPARGLHDIDLVPMAAALRQLGTRHTVVLNEHRTGLAPAADHLIEMGPGAGTEGGEVVYSGRMSKNQWHSPPRLDRPSLEVKRSTSRLKIEGATLHNLQSVDVELPLGRLTCLTGLSGSGKSNFARGVLVPAMARHLGLTLAREDFDVRPGTWRRVIGAKEVRGLVALDHKPPPPNRRSLVVTFLDLADGLRRAFAATPDARQSGLTAGDFGLNAGNGRCPTCQGIGLTDEEGGWVTCSGCGGSGYAQAVLAFHVDGMTIRETLQRPVALLREESTWLGPRRALLDAMTDLGIGHIALGRRLDTLSGGEVQRLRIAQRLAGHDAGGLLFVLDEPAAGLHHQDVRRLLEALDRIVDGGKNTVVLVEHNVEIIRAADWVVDFGPGTGAEGGRIVASGPPATVAKSKTATGEALRAKQQAKAGSGSRTKASKSKSGRTPRLDRENTLAMADRVLASVRRLRGDDVAPAFPEGDEAPVDRPAVVLHPKLFDDCRPHEVLDLELELARLLLDEHAVAARGAAAALVVKWQKEKGWLAVQPFLDHLRDWGDRLPGFSAKEVAEKLRTSHMALVDLSGRPAKPVATRWPDLRATAERFRAAPTDRAAAARRVDEALALGAGYVELRDARGKLLASAAHRLVDLPSGVVGPLAPSARHFSRRHPSGRCPACAGRGSLEALDDKLVLSRPSAKVDDLSLLAPPAGKILKGVWRSELTPLLKRLNAEGLWPGAARFSDLSPREKNILLFGCWIRPGHGTFLKSGKVDPAEAGSWLRWDGLYHRLSQELRRSTDEKWREKVEATRKSVTCYVCKGTGHARWADLLKLEGKGIAEWLQRRTLRDLYEALRRQRMPLPRQMRRLERLRGCLEEAAKTNGKHRLQEPVSSELAVRIGRRCVERFVGVSSVEP